MCLRSQHHDARVHGQAIAATHALVCTSVQPGLWQGVARSWPRGRGYIARPPAGGARAVEMMVLLLEPLSIGRRNGRRGEGHCRVRFRELTLVVKKDTTRRFVNHLFGEVVAVIWQNIMSSIRSVCLSLLYSAFCLYCSQCKYYNC